MVMNTLTSNVERTAKIECPFDGDRIQDIVFAKDETCAAIYNISPIVPGHALAIPIQHVDRLFEMPEADCLRLMRFARRVTELILREFNAEAFDWTIQDGEAAGQTIAHVHLHIIPRVMGDLASPGEWYPQLELERQKKTVSAPIDSAERSRITPEDLTRIVSRLRSAAAGEELWEHGYEV